MTLLIAGTYRVPPGNVDGLKPHMLTMMAKSRAEEGCIHYVHTLDLEEPGLVRVFEAWRDQACLDAHVKIAHFADWRAAGAQMGVSDRRLFAYEVASERAL
jgi:quinol monooxygenase YgiN